MKAAPDENTQAFLRGVQGAQMFDIWGRQRCALAQKGYPRTDLFETRVSAALISSDWRGNY